MMNRALYRGGIVALALSGMHAVGQEADYISSGDPSGFEKLPFQFSVEVRGGYDTNSNTASGETLRDPFTGDVLRVDEEESSTFTTGSLSLSKTLGGPRTNMILDGTVGATKYWDLDEDELDPLISFGALLSHAVTPRLGITANATLSYQSESDYTRPDAVRANNRRRGNYFFANTSIGADYRWTPKFSTATTYNFVAVRYDNSAPGFVEDRIENYISQEFKYLLWPRTTIVAEYRFGLISYEERTERDNTSHYALLGVDHKLGPQMNAGMRAGAQFRTYEGGREVTRPHVEGSLNYNFGERANIRGFVRYGLEQSSIINEETTNTTFRIGMNLGYGFSPKLQSNLSLYYQNTKLENDQADIGGDTTDNSYNASLDLSYYITDHVFLSSQYTFSMLESDDLFGDYVRHRVSVGIGASF